MKQLFKRTVSLLLACAMIGTTAAGVFAQEPAASAPAASVAQTDEDAQPSAAPSVQPSASTEPSASASPSVAPSQEPSAASSAVPAASAVPSAEPSAGPAATPAPDLTSAVTYGSPDDEEGGWVTLLNGEESAGGFSLFGLLRSNGTDVTADTEQLNAEIVRLSYMTTETNARWQDVKSSVDEKTGKVTYDMSGLTFEQLAGLRARVRFDILTNGDDRTLKAGDYFSFTLPEAFSCADTTEDVAIMANNIEIATYKIENNVLTVTFSDIVDSSTAYDIGGKLDMELSLNGDKLTGDETNEIGLTIQANGPETAVKIPGPSSTVNGVEKIGVYDQVHRTITWEIEVGTETPGLSLEGLVLTDSLPEDLVKDNKDNIEINLYQDTEDPENPIHTDITDSVVWDGSSFSYTFTKDENGDCPVAGKTGVTVVTPVPEGVMPTDADVSLTNSVTLTKGEGSPMNVGDHKEDSDIVTLKHATLSKTGEQKDSNTISWAIKVNENAANHLWDVVVTDDLSADVKLVEGSIYVTGADGTPTKVNKVDAAPTEKHEDYQYTAEEQEGGSTLLKIYYPNKIAVSTASTITFETDRRSGEFEINMQVQNQASIEWNWPTWDGEGPDNTRFELESPIVTTTFGAAFVEKEVVADAQTGIMTWTVAPATRVDGYGEVRLIEVIGSPTEYDDNGYATAYEKDHTLVQDSIKVYYGHGHDVIPLVKDRDYELSVDTTTDGNDTFTVTLPAQGGGHTNLSQYWVEYQTKAVNFFEENDKEHIYKNQVQLQVDKGESTYIDSADAEATMQNKMLAKTAVYEYYDEATTDGLEAGGYLHYTIQVNQNKMQATNLTVKDDLTALSTDVLDAEGNKLATIKNDDLNNRLWQLTRATVKQDGVETSDGFTTTTGDWVADQKVDFTVGSTTSQWTIELWLKLNVLHPQLLAEDVAGKADSLRTINTAIADCDEWQVDGGISVQAETDTGVGDVSYGMLDKQGGLDDTNKGKVDWTVRINSNGIDMGSDAIMSDTLPSYLALEYSSMHLYATKHDINGGVNGYDTGKDYLDKSTMLTLTTTEDGSLRFAVDLGKLDEADRTRAYTLVYTTYVVDETPGYYAENAAVLELNQHPIASKSAVVNVDADAAGWLKTTIYATCKKVDEFAGTAMPIANVIFELYGDKDCTQFIDRVVTGADGSFAFYNLTYDADKPYYVKEVGVVGDAHNGYVTNNEPWKLEIGSEPGEYVQANVTNKRERTGEIAIEKKYVNEQGNPIEDLNAYGLQSEFKLEFFPAGIAKGGGQQLTLIDGGDGLYTYYEKPTTEEDPSHTSPTFADVLKNSMTSGAANLAIYKLPWGEYRLTETKAPDGFALSEPIEFVINADGVVDIDGVTQRNSTVTTKGLDKNFTDELMNDKNPGALTNNSTKLTVAKKTTGEGNTLNGVVLAIYYAENGKAEDAAIVKWPNWLNPTVDTDRVYRHTIAEAVTEDTWDLTGLPAITEGSYFLVEETGPGNLNLAVIDPIPFTMDEKGVIHSANTAVDSKTNTITAEDGPIQITVQKLDQNSAAVKGATLALYKATEKEDGEWAYGTDPVTWTTASDDKDHKITVDRGCGYKLVETSLPSGYLNISTETVNTITFEITTTGKMTNVNLYNREGIVNSVYGNVANANTLTLTLRNERILGHASFTKLDTSESPLAGVTFDVYQDANGDGVYDLTDDDYMGTVTSDAKGLVSTLNLKKNGQAAYATGLPLRYEEGKAVDTTYYFAETATPYADFVLDSAARMTFTVLADGSNRYTKNRNAAADPADVTNEYIIPATPADSTVSILQNTPLNATVLLQKTNDATPALAAYGAAFTLTGKDANGKAVNLTSVSAAALTGSTTEVSELAGKYTDSNGGEHDYSFTLDEYTGALYAFVNVPASDKDGYTITETKPALGCQLPANTTIATGVKVTQDEADKLYFIDADAKAGSEPTVEEAADATPVVNAAISTTFYKNSSLQSGDEVKVAYPAYDAKITLTSSNSPAFAHDPKATKYEFEQSAAGSTLKGILIAGNTYTWTETDPATGHLTAAPFTFTVGTDGKLTLEGSPSYVALSTDGTKVIVIDEPYTLTLQKQDAQGNNVEATAGFTLSGKLYDYTTNVSADQTLNLTLDENGQLSLPVRRTETVGEGADAEEVGHIYGMAAGEVYLLAETAPPKGYSLYSLTNSFADAKLTEGALSLCMTAEGYLQYQKADNEWAYVGDNVLGVKNRETQLKISKTDKNGKALTDYTFTVSGQFVDGTKSKTLQAASDALTGQLIVGQSYTISETTPPAGYVSAPDFTVTVNADGSLSAATGSTLPTGVTLGTVAATGQYATVTVTVANEQNEVYLIKVAKQRPGESGNKALAGAVYTLKGKFADGAAEKTLTSSDTENVKLTGQLIAGETYTIRETTPAPGYAISPLTDIYSEAKLDSDGAMTLKMTKEGVTQYLTTGGEYEDLDYAEDEETQEKGYVLVFEDAPIDLTLVKQNAVKEGTEEKPVELKGYAFTIAPVGTGKFADGTTAAKTLSDAQGETSTLKAMLVAGTTYTVTEVTPPEGYCATPSFTIRINADGSCEGPDNYYGELTELVSIDEPDKHTFQYTLKVSDWFTSMLVEKQNEEGARLPDAKFTLTGIFANETEPRAVEITAYTGGVSNGPDNGAVAGLMVAEREYVLAETTPPKGYANTFTPVTLKVDKYGDLYQKNQAAEGEEATWTQVTDNIFVAVDGASSLTLKKTDRFGEPLEGAKFTITGVFADGAAKKTIDLLTTGSENTLTAMLVAGETYTVSETVAPAGYASVKDFTITMNADGSLQMDVGSQIGISLSGTTVTVQNTTIPFALQKTDEEGKALSGATFTVSGHFSDGSEPHTLLRGEDYQRVTTWLLPGETYTFTETTAPDGYLRLARSFTVTTQSDGTLALGKDASELVTLAENNTIVVANAQAETQFEKRSTDNEVLEGGSFRLSGRFVDGSSELTGNAAEITRRLKGNLYASEVTGGQPASDATVYTLTELTAPAGYRLATESVQFVMDDQGQLYLLGENAAARVQDGLLILRNEPVSVTISKVEDHGLPLPGATLQMDGVFADGSSRQTFTSGLFAHRLKALLIAGQTYTITEPKEVRGYHIMMGEVVFTVDEQDQLTLVSAPNNTAALTEDGEGLVITNFRKRGRDDDTDDNTSSGAASTPDGTAKGGEAALLFTPRTGDASNLPLLAAILILAIVVFAFTIYLRRRKK